MGQSTEDLTIKTLQFECRKQSLLQLLPYKTIHVFRQEAYLLKWV